MGIPVRVLQGSSVETLTDGDDALPFQLVHLHLGQKLVSHHLQRVLGPRLEPVDRTTTDQGRKLPQAVGELRTDGTHAEQDVQVLLAPAYEVVEQGEGREFGILVGRLSDG